MSSTSTIADPSHRRISEPLPDHYIEDCCTLIPPTGFEDKALDLCAQDYSTIDAYEVHDLSSQLFELCGEILYQTPDLDFLDAEAHLVIFDCGTKSFYYITIS